MDCRFRARAALLSCALLVLHGGETAAATYESQLAISLGVERARRDAWFLSGLTAEQRNQIRQTGDRLMAVARRGFAGGFYRFRGGVIFSGPADYRDTEQNASYFMDNFCEIIVSGIASRTIAFAKAFPGSGIDTAMFLHELAHCQAPNEALSAFGNPTELAAATLALSDPSALFSAAVQESFADVHALLVLRAIDPARYESAVRVLLAKRRVEETRFALTEPDSAGDEHVSGHAVLLLYRLVRENRIPIGPIGQSAFEIAVRGTLMSAARMKWLGDSLNASLRSGKTPVSTARAAISAVLAFSDDVTPRFRVAKTLLSGVPMRRAYALAKAMHPALERSKGDATALERAAVSIGEKIKTLFPTPACDLNTVARTASALEAIFPIGNQELKLVERTLEDSFGVARGQNAPDAKLPSFHVAAAALESVTRTLPSQ